MPWTLDVQVHVNEASVASKKKMAKDGYLHPLPIQVNGRRLTYFFKKRIDLDDTCAKVTNLVCQAGLLMSSLGGLNPAQVQAVVGRDLQVAVARAQSLNHVPQYTNQISMPGLDGYGCSAHGPFD